MIRVKEKRKSSGAPHEIAVIGAGGWGTALSRLLSRKGYKVSLWEKFPDYAKELSEKRENTKFLPGVRIPEEISITSDLEFAVDDSKIIVLAVPSQYLRETVGKFAKMKLSNVVLVNAAKGIETETLRRLSEVISAEMSGCSGISIGVISGPSHAEEVGRDVPTTVVTASKNTDTAALVQSVFFGPRFRVYTSQDIIGVELGGALKNIIAIAAGIIDGLKLGDNAKAALITRGLAEITRLGVRMGADRFTFSGLAGLGDLAVTCMSKYSRNRRVGERIGQGEKLGEILPGMEMVAEGIRTTEAACRLSRNYSVEMPITEEIYKVLFENKKPTKALEDLLMREAKPEMQFETEVGK